MMDNETKLRETTAVLTALLAFSVFMNILLGFMCDKTLKDWKRGDDELFHALDSSENVYIKEIDSIYRH